MRNQDNRIQFPIKIGIMWLGLMIVLFFVGLNDELREAFNIRR